MRIADDCDFLSPQPSGQVFRLQPRCMLKMWRGSAHLSLDSSDALRPDFRRSRHDRANLIPAAQRNTLAPPAAYLCCCRGAQVVAVHVFAVLLVLPFLTLYSSSCSSSSSLRRSSSSASNGRWVSVESKRAITAAGKTGLHGGVIDTGPPTTRRFPALLRAVP